MSSGVAPRRIRLLVQLQKGALTTVSGTLMREDGSMTASACYSMDLRLVAAKMYVAAPLCTFSTGTSSLYDPPATFKDACTF
eukprot:gene23801-9363_t